MRFVRPQFPNHLREGGSRILLCGLRKIGTVPDGFVVRYLASQAHLQEIHFLWRPMLADADDDMVLELAFASGCQHIITHNVADFRGSEQLGVTAITPRDFLNRIRKKT